MAKPSKLKIEDNPLRKLRSLIGGEKPIPQHKLAGILGLSASTIRSIEAGQRTLGNQSLQRVERTTGASWDQKSKQWLCRRLTGPYIRQEKWHDSRIEVVPCTHDHIQAYLRVLEQTGSLAPDRDRDAVKMRIDALFDQIPKVYWIPLLGRIQNFLDQLRKEFPEEGKRKSALRRGSTLHKLALVFVETTDNAFFITDPESGELRGQRSYPNDIGGLKLLEYRKRMAEKYAEFAKHAHPDGGVRVMFPGKSAEC